MAHFTQTPPIVGGDTDVWGTKLNTFLNGVVTVLNGHDDRIAAVEQPSGSASGLIAYTNGTGGLTWAAAPTGGSGGNVPGATTTTAGIIKLAGHLAGTSDSPQLASLFTDGTQTFGSASAIPRITRDAFGRVTSIVEVPAQQATGLTNPMTATGDLIVGGTGGAPVRLIGSTTVAKRFLTQTGSGTASATPSWGFISVSDVAGATALQTSYVAVNAQTGTAYVLSLGDAGKLVTMGNAAANTVTIPLNSTTAFPIGSWVDIAQYGAGATSIGFVTGVTVRSPGNLLTIKGQYSRLRAIKINTNEWMLEGSFATTNAGGGNQGGGGTTDPGTGSGGSVLNLISDQSIQNASAIALFSAESSTLSIDTSIAQSGGSSIKLAPDSSGAYPYLAPASTAGWAAVTPGQTYTAFASVRKDTNNTASFNCYIIWYDSAGNQLGIGSSNAAVTGVLNSWVQVASSGVAPANATVAAMFVEYAASGDQLSTTATIHIDQLGINAGTSTTWTSGSNQGGTTSPSSITDAGFSYSSNGWNTGTSGGSEHYSSVVGATAAVTFILNGPATFSILGKQDSSNGTMSVSIDGATAVNYSASATSSVDNAVLYTSGTLTAGQHTATITVVSPDGTIQGAKVSNGSFVAPTGTTPPTNPGTGGGTGTSGGNTTRNGLIIAGPASSSNPSGYLPPTLDAFPGYTNVLVQDFNTSFAEGRNNGIAVLGSGWFSYEGQQNGNYNGMYWDTDQISATGSVVTMRNTNAASNCQALTVMYTDSANVGKTHKQQALPYGKTMIRMKARGSTGYKIAFLMWPTTDNWNDGEIDFPEGDTVSPNPSSQPYTMTANTHNITGNPVNGIYTDAASVSGLGKLGVIDDGNWHTFTLHWDPAQIRFEMDGVNMRTVTDAAYIPKVPMRWVLQCEPTQGAEKTAANYIDIDWVAAYKRG